MQYIYRKIASIYRIFFCLKVEIARLIRYLLLNIFFFFYKGIKGSEKGILPTCTHSAGGLAQGLSSSWNTL